MKNHDPVQALAVPQTPQSWLSIAWEESNAMSPRKVSRYRCEVLRRIEPFGRYLIMTEQAGVISESAHVCMGCRATVA
jgi:hypothetical protein